MSKNIPEVRIADIDQERKIIDTLTLAFHSDPLVRWLFPTPTDYLRWCPEFIKRQGGKAFEKGTAYYLGNFVGAALCLPPEINPDEEDLINFWGDALSDVKQSEAWPLFKKFLESRPDQPYWYLTFIGVEPKQQCNGYGSALLEHILNRCGGEVVYLESANPRNLSLYMRYGFELLNPVQIEDAPTVFPMKYDPSDRRTHNE